MYVEGGRTHWKIRFHRIHYKNIIVRAPCDKDGAWINIKVIRKRNTSVEGLAGQEVELINTPTANLLCTFPTHWVSSRPETTAAENLITSLFDQLHFNNVSSDDLFHGDHLVMQSERCAVQNQRITLNWTFWSFSVISKIPVNNFGLKCKMIITIHYVLRVLHVLQVWALYRVKIRNNSFDCT